MTLEAKLGGMNAMLAAPPTDLVIDAEFYLEYEQTKSSLDESLVRWENLLSEMENPK